MKSIIVVGGFILFDIVTGVIKGLAKEGLNSTLLRKGLFHKISELLAAIGALGLEYGVKYININVELPLLPAVASYICIMELISIIENICEVNPTMYKLFKPYLEKLKNKTEDDK